MKERLLTNWHVGRIFYVIAGVAVSIMSIAEHQWQGTALGAYLLIMGVFSLGCASGSCAYRPPVSKKNQDKT